MGLIYKGICNRNLSLKKGSLKIFSISQIWGLQLLSCISFVRSPPLRQISPLGWGRRFSKGLLHLQRFFNGATARETTRSNFLFFMSSARVCCCLLYTSDAADE